MKSCTRNVVQKAHTLDKGAKKIRQVIHARIYHAKSLAQKHVKNTAITHPSKYIHLIHSITLDDSWGVNKTMHDFTRTCLQVFEIVRLIVKY